MGKEKPHVEYHGLRSRGGEQKHRVIAGFSFEVLSIAVRLVCEEVVAHGCLCSLGDCENTYAL